MKYTYSRLSSESVKHIIKLHYNLSEPISCKYYIFGLHDNYLIENKKKKYIFRIYRNDWRTDNEIFFELDFLRYVDKKTSTVAAPIMCNSSKLYTSIESPEGKRIAVLFYYADGFAPEDKLTFEECILLGNSVANIHQSTVNFKTKFTRPILNNSFLLDRSLELIKSFVTSQQYSYLQSIQIIIKNKLSQLNPEIEDFGICIGDVNSTNFHIDQQKKITHFDFDQCGYGFRVFDIGKFASTLYSHKQKNECLQAFVQGYESIRCLTDLEKKTIPYFEITSVIWVMSIHVSNVNKIGFKYLEDSFWTNRIARIEALMEDLD